MWRLFNTLFGWHYVIIRSPVMDYRYLRRVRRDSHGNMYIDFHSRNLWFLLPDGKVDNGYTWRPLTW